MKVRAHGFLRQNMGMKRIPQNCGALIAKIDFLTTKCADKLSVQEKLELLDMLKTFESRKQYLPFTIRVKKHARLDELIQACRTR